ncbi:MAG: M20/M25/M40 family metallo-hydrolase [Hydrogenoanaerobacterium sp.]
METKELVKQLSQAVGVSGAENNAAQLAVNTLAPLGAAYIDTLGSVICNIQPQNGSKRHYMLDAHIDEIGMIVTGITEDGFLRLGSVGGLDRRLLLASELTVHGKKPLLGIVCSTPPHLQGEGEKKNPKLDEIFIDIGMGHDAAVEAVSLGDRITFKSCFCEMPDGCVTGKALDDRAGCAAVIKAAEMLKKKGLSCGLTVTLTVQEETGAAGAKVAAFAVSPTHCFTVDVSFAHTPDAKPEKCGELGKGPMIGIAPILSQALSQRLIETAKTKKIPFQLEVMGGSTGTNADAIAASGAGVITALVSVPQRYMHTPTEKVCIKDIDDTARLIAETIIELEASI